MSHKLMTKTGFLCALYHHHNPSGGALILRTILGVVFVYSGWMKLSAMAMTVGFFASMGLSPGMAHFVAWTELVAGTLLILGVLVKPSSVALATIMSVVVFGFPAQGGPFWGHEFEFTLLVSLLALYVMGPGTYSVGCMCGGASCCGKTCKGSADGSWACPNDCCKK